MSGSVERQSPVPAAGQRVDTSPEIADEVIYTTCTMCACQRWLFFAEAKHSVMLYYQT